MDGSKSFEKKDYNKRDDKASGKSFSKGGPAATPQNRRQKQKVSDLVKKLRINYNQLLMKKKDRKSEDPEIAAAFKKDKHNLVEECIKLIGEKYMEVCLKHDGSRILQALIKFGHREHRN